MAVLDLLPPTLHSLSPLVDPDAEPAPPALLLTGERAFWLRTARRFVGEALVDAGVSDDMLGDVLVMLEDAVAEALRQSGARSVTVTVAFDDAAGSVEVEVRERGSLSGFDAAGVASFDALAEQWGVSRRNGSSGLWFRVPLRYEAPDRRISA